MRRKGGWTIEEVVGGGGRVGGRCWRRGAGRVNPVALVAEARLYYILRYRIHTTVLIQYDTYGIICPYSSASTTVRPYVQWL